MRTEEGQQLVSHSDDDRNRICPSRIYCLWAPSSILCIVIAHYLAISISLTNYQRIAICIMRKGRRLNLKRVFDLRFCSLSRLTQIKLTKRSY
ncbi:hypothetical protein CEXT_555941 [Caerostris extrusa]|uniref:Ycf15 n=1 Tax=Caerostris extrusa TaxID=172846 RepID=A0AAV4TGQ5_CAEEX|nr:hypothetical protein CEXT_555941 [Caerostris extrusa]